MLNNILSKKIKNVKISWEQKHPFNRKSKNKKNKKRFLVFQLKFHDQIILNKMIIFVNIINIKENVLRLNIV